MYRKTTLDNGIRVVTEHIPHVYSVSIGLWIKTGSRDEKQEENGISHYIEHMLFKGTKRRSAHDIAKEIDAVGGILNASTSREFTNFYAKVLDRDFELAIDLLSDIFLNSTFLTKELERERGVIFQEIKMVEDTPDEYIQDLFNQRFFSENPLGFPILGNYQTIGGITKRKVVDFFQNYYLRPLRIVVAVAGRINHNLVVERITQTLGHLLPQEENHTFDTPQPVPGVHIFSKDLEQVHLCMGTKGISQTHPFRYGVYVLNVLLGGSMSSRLFQEIREKRGLAYVVLSYLSSYSDTGMLNIYAGTSQNKVNKVVELVIRELKRLKRIPLEKTELEKAKEQLKGNILLSYESTDVRMSRLAKGELYFGKFIPMKEILTGIDRVSADDIQQLAGEVFQNRFFSLAALGKVTAKDLSPELLSL